VKLKELKNGDSFRTNSMKGVVKKNFAFEKKVGTEVLVEAEVFGRVTFKIFTCLSPDLIVRK
jgi:hypothetical protein